MQFIYGVFLLNKNIAQLRWLYNMHTQDLKLTLPNLLNFLQGYKESKQERFMVTLPNKKNSSEDANLQNPFNVIHKLPPLCSFTEWSSKYDRKMECPLSPEFRNDKNRFGNGDIKSAHLAKGDYLTLSELLMNKQISSESFTSYLSNDEGVKSVATHPTLIKHGNTLESTRTLANNQLNCDISSNIDSNKKKTDSLPHCESVEEGTDLLNPKSTFNDLVVDTNVTSEENTEPKLLHCDKGVFINERNKDVAEQANLISQDQEEFMQTWLRTGPALVCSDKNLYPDEYLGSTSSVQNADSPLTARTDALVSTKSFNLVRPKH